MSVQRSRGRPPVLSTDMIVDAAITLVTRTGTMTMTDLGAELGVDPSALYRYHRTRSDLVSAIADRFTAPLAEAAQPTDDWRADFESILRRIDDLYRSNPPVALLILTESDLSGATLGIIGAAVDVLRRSGADDRAVFETLHAVEIALAGSILYDLVGAPDDDQVRRTYHRRIGRFDIDTLYPTADDLAAESRSTAWRLVEAALDGLDERDDRHDLPQ